MAKIVYVLLLMALIIVTAAPAKHFSPNGYGLFDMAGNVWEVLRRLG